MHELSLALSILSIIEQEVARQGDGALLGRVAAVGIRIGTLSGVEPEALSFAWEVARERGPFQDADLKIEMVPAKARCANCGAEFLLGDGGTQCAACGPCSFQVVAGRELLVSRLFLQTEEVIK